MKLALPNWRIELIRAKGRIAIFFLLAAVLITHGCIAAATTAIVTGVAQGGDKSARVVVPELSDRVYEIALNVFEKDPDIEIISADPYRLVIDAKKGDDLITVKSKHIVRGRTELVVLAHSDDEWKRGEEPALELEKKMCDEFGIKYIVEEEKPMEEQG